MNLASVVCASDCISRITVGSFSTARSSLPTKKLSASDAVDGSSTGTRVP